MKPMDMALREAEAAGARGDVPVGAVVTGADGAVLAVAGNGVEAGGDVTAHAEMIVLRRAVQVLGGKYLRDCTLTVTLEPCAMCAGAIAAFRVGRLVFGAYDPKSGAVEHGPRVFAAATTHHKPEVVGGVEEVRAAVLLKGFFEARRG
jgi:tRNA(Arg) A34 adenosine deaminase TadA